MKNIHLFTSVLLSLLLMTGCGALYEAKAENHHSSAQSKTSEKTSKNDMANMPNMTNKKMTSQNDKSVVMKLNQDSFQIKKNSRITLTVTQDKQPLEHADVQMEIWEVNAEKHEFVPLKPDTQAGTYSFSIKFNKITEYNFTFHVQTKKLHSMTSGKIAISK